jgi:transposase-like protein
MGKWRPNVDRDTFGRGSVYLISRSQAQRLTQAHWAVDCKYCGGPNVVKFGTYRGNQRYWCKDCERKFADNNALPGMRVPPDQVGAALSMFYGGTSIGDIRRHSNQVYGLLPSKSTVYRWIVRYTRAAVAIMSEFSARTGDVWVADETILKIGGSNLWFWDVIDDSSRMLIASRITTSRFTRDTEALFNKAQERVTRTPKVILTDKLRAYIGSIEEVFGADVAHIQSRGFRLQPNTNLIERFHGTLKARTKVMRGMANRETAKLVTDGWLVHYNFMRPHESLK